MEFVESNTLETLSSTVKGKSQPLDSDSLTLQLSLIMTSFEIWLRQDRYAIVMQTN